ncbi:TetR/AcrR family transcriptional regulator [Mycobacterium sp. DL592]|uniref:TetR/AcrR family transcriptional regulator n=1 Tax=Mycobacterium sp. DL592 TaxID=2675524 RepID=UPI0014206C06|nr:TetR/AcrR family transcriptional regulator [Mycobacterium sp. DL592]
MGRQARAEATRRRIIDAAVELFIEPGYGETGLAEILARADVTKGAFYYHFESKEAVAAAIIDESVRRVSKASSAVIASSAPALENIIRSTFIVADVKATDPLVAVGKQLARSLTQISDHGPKAFVDLTTLFVGQVRAAVDQGDLVADLDADEVGAAVWAAVLGSHLLSDATGEQLPALLERAWRVLLGGIVGAESLPYFRDFVTRTYQAYAHAPLTAQ